jgi:hypothetical protein
MHGNRVPHHELIGLIIRARGHTSIEIVHANASRPAPGGCLSSVTKCMISHIRAGAVVVSLFVRLLADGRCWFVLREKYYWLVGDG